MYRCTILVLALILSGCSTVEKRGYYEPIVTPILRVGPEKPVCGWANFGGAPDKFVSNADGHAYSVKAAQYLHPYLWGPWFASVIPVFPITWAAETFINDDLQIAIDAQPGTLITNRPEDFFISFPSSHGTKVYPSSVKSYASFTHLKFPVDADDVEEFVFHIKAFREEVEIPFTKATRWSWTQWTPNC